MLLDNFDLEATKGLYLSFYRLRSHGNVLEVMASNRVIKDKEVHVILGVIHRYWDDRWTADELRGM